MALTPSRETSASSALAVFGLVLALAVVIASNAPHANPPVAAQLPVDVELWQAGCGEQLAPLCSQSTFAELLDAVQTQRRELGRDTVREVHLDVTGFPSAAQPGRAVLLGHHRARPVVLLPPVGALRLPRRLPEAP